MRRHVAARLSLTALLLAGGVAACGGDDADADDTSVSAPASRIGPVRAGYQGQAYPVPEQAEVDGHANAVAVQVADGTTEYLPAGTPVDVVMDDDEGQVEIVLGDGTNATGDPDDFWVMPSFVELKDFEITVDGRPTTLRDSGIVYHRGDRSLFDDPATAEFDGISAMSRSFLACESDTWTIGQQTFTVDLVENGIAKRDQGLIEDGIKGLEWGMDRPLNDEAVHELHRDCDDKTVADFGETHHTTQWLESMGRALYLLASSEYAGEYRDTIDALRERIQVVATGLADADNWDNWVSKIEHKQRGGEYTHRTFMMAAGMGLASTIADDPDDAELWADKAATIAKHGIDNQWDEGVNPELSGYDVQYQAYGTWLAQVYDSTLEPGTEEQQALEDMIDKAIAWERGRVKPNGQFDTTGSSRICAEVNWWSETTSERFDPEEAIRTFFLWSDVQGRPELADLAVTAARGEERYGNACPVPPRPSD